MANNKRCHSHLANREIIQFITAIFQTQFYGKYSTRAENDALHRTIKQILQIYWLLLNGSMVSKDILENNVIPIFSRIDDSLQQQQKTTIHSIGSANSITRSFSNEISSILKKLNDSVSNNNSNHHRSPSSSSHLSISVDANRSVIVKKVLESYV